MEETYENRVFIIPEKTKIVDGIITDLQESSKKLRPETGMVVYLGKSVTLNLKSGDVVKFVKSGGIKVYNDDYPDLILVNDFEVIGKYCLQDKKGIELVPNKEFEDSLLYSRMT